jgi:hypothetical protein
MAVLVEAIRVVVRRETLDRVYPGGVAGYEVDCPNSTFCTDEHLTAVGFMNPTDTRVFVERLVADLGRGFVGEDGFLDIAVVDERTGPTAPCDWLAFLRLPGNYSICWLEGTHPGEVALGAGRTAESLGTMRYLPPGEAENQLDHLGPDERGLEVYRDRASGKLLYLGRPFGRRGPRASDSE